MAEFDTDLFVIGGGSGGVRAARIAAGYGARVMLAEEYRLGGTCVIRGCVPKKLLVYASRFSHEFEDAAGFGWTVGGTSFDWPTLIANKDKEIARLEAAYTATLMRANVSIFKSRAVLEDALPGAEASHRERGALDVREALRSRSEQIGRDNRVLRSDAVAVEGRQRADLVSDCEVLGPPDIESRIGLTGGNIFQGEVTPDQMWEGRLSARTPVTIVVWLGQVTVGLMMPIRAVTPSRIRRRKVGIGSLASSSA